MDYAVSWGGDPEDVCVSTSGVVRVADLDALWRELLSDDRWRDGMKVLVDHSRADWSRMPVEEMEERAAFVKQQSAAIGSQQVAMVMAEPGSYRVMRLIGLLLDWGVDWVMRVFTSHDEAREWLREPSHLAFGHAEPPPKSLAETPRFSPLPR